MSKPLIPPFTERTITNRIDARSVQRGRKYAQQGSIVAAQVQGNRLQAQCFGSRSIPYRVYVEFEKGRITEADCTCPVGDGGYCKHTAALLFTWLNNSDKFVATPPLQENLKSRDKSELIEIIKRML